jgi:hypothetical protein
MKKPPGTRMFPDFESDMLKPTQFPKPWWQVGLTVLPGLFYLLSATQFLMLGMLIGLGLASFWSAFKRRNLLEIPVWGLIPLGWFAFLVFAFLPYSLGFYETCLLLVLISLPLVSKNGLSAGLFLLIGGSIAANLEVEPFIYVWDSPIWSLILIQGGMALFMIVTPIWVLRSRTLFGQALGLMLPLAAYIASFVFALSSGIGYLQPERFQFSISKAISIAEPFVGQLVILAFAVLLYTWITSRTRVVNEV